MRLSQTTQPSALDSDQRLIYKGMTIGLKAVRWAGDDLIYLLFNGTVLCLKTSTAQNKNDGSGNLKKTCEDPDFASVLLPPLIPLLSK